MAELQKKHNCPVVGGGDLNSTRALPKRCVRDMGG